MVSRCSWKLTKDYRAEKKSKTSCPDKTVKTYYLACGFYDICFCHIANEIKSFRLDEGYECFIGGSINLFSFMRFMIFIYGHISIEGGHSCNDAY